MNEAILNFNIQGIKKIIFIKIVRIVYTINILNEIPSINLFRIRHLKKCKMLYSVYNFRM